MRIAEEREIIEILATPLDLHKYPDVYSYDKVLERVLWTLDVVEKEFGIDYLASAQIAKLLTERFRIKTFPQAVNQALREAGGMVDGLKRGGITYWKITGAGRRHISLAQIPESILIEPMKPFTGKRMVITNILARLKGEIKICDPYCGIRTLDMLSEINGKTKVSFLTRHLEDKERFLREYGDFKREHKNIEIKVYEQSELHDRYLITKEEAWMVGHSLKDLGKKESIITKLGIDIKEALWETFNRRWKIAKKLL